MKNYFGYIFLFMKIEIFLCIVCCIFGYWMLENGEDIFCFVYVLKFLIV